MGRGFYPLPILNNSPESRYLEAFGSKKVAKSSSFFTAELTIVNDGIDINDSAFLKHD